MEKTEEITETPKDDERDAPKIRDCLRCGTPFESAWSGERICKRCKSSSAWKNGAMHGSFAGGRG